MDGTLQNTLIVLASLVAGVLVAQTILLVVLLLAFRKFAVRTGTMLEEITRNVEPVLQSARELLTDGREKLGVLTTNLNEIAVITKSQMTRIDGFLKDTSERAQMQVVRLDKLIGDTIDRVETTTEAVQRGVMVPMQEMSALVRGVQTAINYFFNRRRTVERATQDEELFI